MRYALPLILLGAPAFAEGFARPDLTEIDAGALAFEGGSFTSGAEPGRLTCPCESREDFVAVQAMIGAGDAGTEARLRAGGATVADMEALCRERAPECTMEGIEAGAAVGWISLYETGIGAGLAAVLLRDGEIDGAVADGNARAREGERGGDGGADRGGGRGGVGRARLGTREAALRAGEEVRLAYAYERRRLPMPDQRRRIGSVAEPGPGISVACALTGAGGGAGRCRRASGRGRART